MSDTNQEPTMEEILASIRRIISEDDAPQAEAGGEDTPAAVAEPIAAAAFEPEASTAGEDEVLDLTQRVEEPPAYESSSESQSVGDLDVYERPEEPAPRASEPEPEPYVAPEPTPAPRPEPARETYASASADEGLVSGAAAASAASAFGLLSQSLLMPREGRSLEDVVQELLKPMLKEWLDNNLPEIVQRAVQEEVERIARGRVR